MGRRRLGWVDIREALVDAARMSATLVIVLIGALVFSNFVNIGGLTDGRKELVTGSDLSPIIAIVVILLIHIALGCVFESLSMLLLTIPVFLSRGRDPGSARCGRGRDRVSAGGGSALGSGLVRHPGGGRNRKSASSRRRSASTCSCCRAFSGMSRRRRSSTA